MGKGRKNLVTRLLVADLEGFTPVQPYRDRRHNPSYEGCPEDFPMPDDFVWMGLWVDPQIIKEDF